MPTYTVHFSRTVEIGVTITADDPDTALDLAYGELPAGTCASCSGYGHTRWWRAESDDSEYEYVTDAVGKTVQSSGERWTRTRVSE